MIRILFGVLILAIFFGVYLYFMYAIRGEGKRWFFGAEAPLHLVGIFIGAICAVTTLFVLAQPIAFLKYIFG